MSDDSPPTGARQGFTEPWRERLPLPAPEAMDAAQCAAAQALIDGPRKGVYGPFLPLLRSPKLLERVAAVGEYLRFDSVLDVRIRELVTCAAARHVTNQFEWLMHAPLALKAGVAPATIEALRVGARPTGLPAEEEAALDFSFELLRNHGVSQPAYEAALQQFGEQGVVELSTLLGYFVMVSWLMNVAHTPAQASAQGEPLQAFPL
ncbi:MAG: carboxymuconolactone decarboxylase family protein [Comamonadaceae bacterium]|nr:MAG: carboxymuconolactone decarboxylase family protein [Comamonadaceae bacterium]